MELCGNRSFYLKEAEAVGWRCLSTSFFGKAEDGNDAKPWGWSLLLNTVSLAHSLSTFPIFRLYCSYLVRARFIVFTSKACLPPQSAFYFPGKQTIQR